MSKQISVSYVDTPVEGKGTTFNVALPTLNWTADYRVRSEDPDEVKLENLTAPLGEGETFRFGYKTVKDVYNGLNIEPSLRSQIRTGVQILAQRDVVVSVTDTEDPTYKVVYPVTAHVVIKVPNDPMFTAGFVQEQVNRMFASLFPSGTNSADRINALLHGVLKP